MARILLLMATRTYRSHAFMAAARRLGVEVVVGSERRQALASRAGKTTVTLDFAHPERAVAQATDFARELPLDAIIGVDDDTTVLAAMVARALGLPHNAVEAVRAARDKEWTRRLLSDAGLPSPRFLALAVAIDPREVAPDMPYPCVLKPVALAASRGVIRVDDAAGFIAAFGRIAAMLQSMAAEHRRILVESFLPGPEVALEGLLTRGSLRLLALFDKPDPLDGPYFEETLYVTPSRLAAETQAAIVEMAARAARVLGLHDGPLHAELRIGSGGPYVVELAPRSIGGLCSNTLRFGTGMRLEELLLRHAMGEEIATARRETSAAGVMMLPIPRGGRLLSIRGKADALAVPGIESLEMTIPLGQPVVPLPEGDRYLGFLFARGEAPEQVETALRTAHALLGFVIAAPGEATTTAPCLPARPTPLRLPLVRGSS